MAEALVVIDMLNTYDHADAQRCAANAKAAVPRMQRVIAAAREAGHPVVYVNDHYGIWTSDRSRIIDTVLERTRSRALVEPVLPEPNDPLLFKARHSTFYETSLAYLLNRLDVQRLTMIGQVTEQCILYSALDAYVRHLAVRVVADAVVGIDDDLAAAALRMMARNMHAEVIDSAELSAAWRTTG